MADETKSSSDGSPPEPKSLLGLESEGRPEMITVEAEPEIVSPRVTRASLPPVALENGALECPVRPRVRFRARGHRKFGAAMDFYTRVVAAINPNAHRPAAAAFPTGSGIMAMSSPRTIGSARGCRSTSSTSSRRRAVVKARATRAPTASVGIPWGGRAPRPARAERPLFVHIFINDLLLWYLSTATSSMASLGFLRPARPQACRLALCGAAIVRAEDCHL